MANEDNLSRSLLAGSPSVYEQLNLFMGRARAYQRPLTNRQHNLKIRFRRYRAQYEQKIRREGVAQNALLRGEVS